MSPVSSFMARRAGSLGAFAAVVFYVVVAAHAQSADSTSDNGPTGRIDFDEANLPPATVEVDLSQGMFRDLFGLGDAAVAGVAETLLKSADANNGAAGTRLAAEQLAAARQIMEIAGNVVREVRVRVYQGLPEESEQADKLMSHYDGQLRAGSWETIVRVRKGDGNARISLLRSEGAVRGAFIVAANGRDLVLANVVGDISPENVKKLTSAATKIGLENGLEQVIEAKMRKLDRRLPPKSPLPPDRPSR